MTQSFTSAGAWACTGLSAVLRVVLGPVVEGHDGPRDDREQEAVRADLEVEIHQRVKGDCQDRNREAQPEQTQWVAPRLQRRPPVSAYERAGRGQEYGQADETRLPAQLQVVVVRAIPPLRGPRRRVGGETLLERPESRSQPQKVVTMLQHGPPDDDPGLE